MATGSCGDGLFNAQQFKKRNANGNTDGGHFTGREFTFDNYMTLYSCPRECMYIRQKVEGTVLSDPVTKSSRGTCVNYLKADEACSVTKAAGDVDCTPCAGIFN